MAQETTATFQMYRLHCEQSKREKRSAFQMSA